MLADTIKALAAYEVIAKEMATKLSNDPLPELGSATQHLFGAGAPAVNKASAQMAQLVERRSASAKNLSEETNAIYANIRTLLIVLTLGGVLAGVALGVLITRSLTRQLGGEPGDVANAANAIASGDLSTHIDTQQAQPGSVVHAMHEMQAALRRIVSTVRESSDSIATGAQQIATGNSDLSQRTETQASNLERNRRLDGRDLQHRANQRRHGTPGHAAGHQRQPGRPRKAARSCSRWCRPWSRSTPPREDFRHHRRD